MNVSLDTPVSLICTNTRRVGALKALGVTTVGDALTYYPFRITEPVPSLAVRQAKVGVPMAFAAHVLDVRVIPMGGRRGFRLEALVDDSDFADSRRVTGSRCKLVFFSHKKQYVDWMSARLRSAAAVALSGAPTNFNGQLQLTHPEVLIVAPEGATIFEASVQNAEHDVHGAADGDDKSLNDTGIVAVADATALVRNGVRYDARTSAEALKRLCRPRPVYHASARISSDHIHESVLAMLDALQQAETEESVGLDVRNDTAYDIDALRQAIADILPADVRSAKHLMRRADAFLAIHDPQSTEQFRKGIQAMRYEEAFVAQTSVLQARAVARKADAFDCRPGQALRERFVDSLPFDPTEGQRTVIDDICNDMGHGYPMQRLLQGEVGSGKTVVALAAMLQAVGAGYQTVLVAPTQVLAEQHARSIQKMVAELDGEVPVTLLTGGMKLAARRRALAQSASGAPGITIATHAAFSKTFQAPNLALAVIDEQHRFGVEQREMLREKSEKTPHLLVMTATPIPRTAAMTWFGDLDISTLTELPGGRKPIRTVVVPEMDASTMARMFVHIRRRIDAGERAYVVCPRIDDNQTATGAGAGRSGRGDEVEGDFMEADFGQDDQADAAPKPPLHSVDEIAARLASLPQFAGVSFSTLTGRDDDQTKHRVMADFESGKTPVLVATTVIEVGVDVPLASCIVIFDADRYGLTQLHQLRGRVGRGGTKSWAFLVSRAEPGSIAEQRVSVVADTLDGAKIAEADLELRGAGDVLGDAQSGGKSGLKLLRVVQDANIIADARSRASALLERDPSLAGHVGLAGAVLDFTRGGESEILSN